jgi:flagellar biosynthesis anti-sigma factor FlgM
VMSTEIQNSLDGLKSLVGVTKPVLTAPRFQTNATANGGGLDSDQAVLSHGRKALSLTANTPEVRAEKVAAIQAALGQGTYNVPESAVASKMVDAMLGGER